MTRWIRLFPVLVACLALVGCGEDGGNVTVNFTHDVDGESLVLNDIRYTNENGDDYSVTSLVYYVSNIQLIRTNGDTYNFFNGVVYRDAADAGTGTVKGMGVAGGTYDMLRFTFGLTDDVNVTDGLPATTENINMAWPEPMGGGYHYMKLEGNFTPSGGGDAMSYRTHTGRNGTLPHFFTVTVPFNAVTVDGNDHTITVSMNINQWYENPTTLAMTTDPIMANVDRQNELAANGASAFTATAAAGN